MPGNDPEELGAITFWLRSRMAASRLAVPLPELESLKVPTENVRIEFTAMLSSNMNSSFVLLTIWNFIDVF
jgi:hypothetical protein